MASIGNAYKVSGAVAAATSTYSQDLYTCPANSYAILNVQIGTGNVSSGVTLSVGGQRVAVVGSGINQYFNLQIVVGPGQVVHWEGGGVGSTSYCYISGVAFTNS